MAQQLEVFDLALDAVRRGIAAVAATAPVARAAAATPAARVIPIFDPAADAAALVPPNMFPP